MNTDFAAISKDRESRNGKTDITLADRVQRELQHDIVSGVLLAGQPLRLEFLRERYGISFSPLREALNRLHAERLIVSTPSRGFRVAPFSEEEMWDAINTRILIECEALRLSILYSDDHWESRLIGAFHALMLCADRISFHDFSSSANDLEQRHDEFHQALISACKSRWLIDLSQKLHMQTERYRQPSLRDREYWNVDRDITSEHRAIMDAAVQRNADKACSLLAEHYRETGYIVQKILQSKLSSIGDL